MKKISRYIMKYWYAYLTAIVCMVTSIALDMMYPMISQKLVDHVILEGKMDLLKGLLLGIILVGIGRSIFGYFKEYIFDSVSSKIGTEIRADLFHHIQGLSRQYFDKTNTGELMARLKEDVDNVWNALGFVGMLMIEVCIHVSVVIYCMLHLSSKLSILPMIAMPIIGTLAILMEKKLNKIYEEISEENARLNTVAEENLSGMRTVKAFAREKFEIKKFLAHNNRYYDLNIKQSKVLVKYQPYFQFVTKLLPFAVVIFGGVPVIQGEITLGVLVAFTEYSRNIVWPMEMLGWLTNDFSSAVASLKKIKKIYEEETLVKEVENPIVLDKLKGDITFENVSLTLDHNKILDEISFHVKAGETIGIMGATGAGKTSIIQLLQRFYDIDPDEKGSVLLDGTDIRSMTLKQVRESSSLVMQDVFLFSDTINENIKMGKRESITRENIEESAEFAQAKDFIEEMDKKYETIIGERGVGLSGGQKQRISIARAVAKKKPILVLDDSTSALDMETEHLIQKELSELKNVTKVIIAHRISAVRHAQEIIFLENGKIAERGTHEELLEKRGLYYETYMAQYGEFLEVRA
ncbi:MAG: ABC transporter ATP-binding protein [Acetivibrio sp.]